MCLEFKKIDYIHKDLIIKFRAVGFFTSFGTESDFWEADGNGGERYFDWLQKQDPSKFQAFHVLKASEIIGQLELNLMDSNPDIGWVNYFYLMKDQRGRGYAQEMQAFLESYYLKKNIRCIRLAVSPSNLRAYKFYENMGWSFLEEKDYINKDGINLGHKIHILEKNLNMA